MPPHIIPNAPKHRPPASSPFRVIPVKFSTDAGTENPPASRAGNATASGFLPGGLN
jgi:hypothetical protein